MDGGSSSTIISLVDHKRSRTGSTPLSSCSLNFSSSIDVVIPLRETEYLCYFDTVYNTLEPVSTSKSLQERARIVKK